jgi:predicted ATP-grasp superfamily ATP-dependent carboligase
MRTALVLGSDARISLSVIRSLGRGGVRVHAAWHDPGGVALRSRYLFRAHALPPYRPGDTAWRDALAALMTREQFDLVLPCTELEVTACQEQRVVLENCGRVYLLGDEAFAVLFDKVRTAELARSVGVCTPREVVLTEAGQEVPAEFGLPLVLKPRASLDRARPDSLLRVRKAYSHAELDRLLPEMLAGGPVAVQENFIGRGVGVELLLKEGEPLLSFQHVRVHEPLHGGPSSYRKSEDVSPDLLEAALKVLRPLRYTGVAMAEFKVNPITGAWVFLEVNARFWGSLPLALAAGADFPLALFRLLVEGQVPAPRAYRRGICCRNLTLDLEWQRANLGADHADPTLATRPLGRVLGDAFWNVLTGRERIDMLTLDDPGPGLAELGQLARRLGARLRKAWRRAAAVPAEAPAATPAPAPPARA